MNTEWTLYIQSQINQTCSSFKGESARKVWEGCLRDNEVWYEQMGKNLKLIEDLAASKDLEEEDFLG